MTRETVATDTLALRATSRMVEDLADLISVGAQMYDYGHYPE
jgi:hypothetical protein